MGMCGQTHASSQRQEILNAAHMILYCKLKLGQYILYAMFVDHWDTYEESVKVLYELFSDNNGELYAPHHNAVELYLLGLLRRHMKFVNLIFIIFMSSFPCLFFSCTVSVLLVGLLHDHTFLVCCKHCWLVLHVKNSQVMI